MKVNTNVTPGNIDTSSTASRSSTAAAAATTDDLSTDTFTKSTTLENTLSQLPLSRPEAVARAKELINDPNYPSVSAIKQLANFFADKIGSNEA